MLYEEHLTWRLVRLRNNEEWRQRAGQSFLFPKGGGGSYLLGGLAQRLSPGDVAVLNGDQAGKLCVANGGEVAFGVFSLSLEDLFPLFGSNEISLLQMVVEGLKGIKLYPASSVLAAECHRLIGELPPQFNLDQRSQLLRVAAAILTEEFKCARHQRVGHFRLEEHLVQAFEELSSGQLLNLSGSELADKFGEQIVGGRPDRAMRAVVAL